jgi:membrane protein insertase Oxa1/YidC/SpoIIIJ
MKFVATNIKSLLAIFVTVCSFGYFFVTYFQGKTQADPQIIIAIVAALTQVLNYYYGSSQGSSKQSETIANMASTAKPTSTVTSAETVNVNTTNNPVKEDEESKG